MSSFIHFFCAAISIKAVQFEATKKPLKHALIEACQ
jgi:hypothetical protein